MTISWTPTTSSLAQYQEVQYKLKGGTNWQTYQTNIPMSTSSIPLNLLNSSLYEYKVVTHCNFGGPNPSYECMSYTITSEAMGSNDLAFEDCLTGEQVYLPGYITNGSTTEICAIRYSVVSTGSIIVEGGICGEVPTTTTTTSGGGGGGQDTTTTTTTINNNGGETTTTTTTLGEGETTTTTTRLECKGFMVNFPNGVGDYTYMNCDGQSVTVNINQPGEVDITEFICALAGTVTSNGGDISDLPPGEIECNCSICLPEETTTTTTQLPAGETTTTTTTIGGGGGETTTTTTLGIGETTTTTTTEAVPDTTTTTTEIPPPSNYITEVIIYKTETIADGGTVNVIGNNGAGTTIVSKGTLELGYYQAYEISFPAGDVNQGAPYAVVWENLTSTTPEGVMVSIYDDLNPTPYQQLSADGSKLNINDPHATPTWKRTIRIDLFTLGEVIVPETTTTTTTAAPPTTTTTTTSAPETTTTTTTACVRPGGLTNANLAYSYNIGAGVVYFVGDTVEEVCTHWSLYNNASGNKSRSALPAQYDVLEVGGIFWYDTDTDCQKVDAGNYWFYNNTYANPSAPDILIVTIGANGVITALTNCNFVPTTTTTTQPPSSLTLKVIQGESGDCTGGQILSVEGIPGMTPYVLPTPATLGNPQTIENLPNGTYTVKVNTDMKFTAIDFMNLGNGDCTFNLSSVQSSESEGWVSVELTNCPGQLFTIQVRNCIGMVGN